MSLYNYLIDLDQSIQIDELIMHADRQDKTIIEMKEVMYQMAKRIEALEKNDEMLSRHIMHLLIGGKNIEPLYQEKE